LQNDNVGVRDVNKMPPLLQRLSERRPEQLDYLGVSYGLTKDLLRFWKRAGYAPLYVRQTANDLTGEHTCVMLKTLNGEVAGSSNWLAAFAQGEARHFDRIQSSFADHKDCTDFRRRFLSLLSYKFREFDAALALSVIEGASSADSAESASGQSFLKTAVYELTS
jgi:N-acetyltransferase 10